MEQEPRRSGDGDQGEPYQHHAALPLWRVLHLDFPSTLHMKNGDVRVVHCNH
jgi:hypothetical protein